MKQELRKAYLQLRDQIDPKRRSEASVALLLHIQSLSATFDRLASFSSIRNEIDLAALNHAFAKTNRLLLPRIHESEIAFYQVTDLSQLIQSGILFEPNPALCPVAALTPRDLLLVPALAFDHDHYRLGYGKGHYDRFLSKQSGLQTVGIGFTEQMSQAPLPRDPWDLPVKSLWLS